MVAEEGWGSVGAGSDSVARSEVGSAMGIISFARANLGRAQCWLTCYQLGNVGFDLFLPLLNLIARPSPFPPLSVRLPFSLLDRLVVVVRSIVGCKGGRRTGHGRWERGRLVANVGGLGC